jgi:hypothetical protein
MEPGVVGGVTLPLKFLLLPIRHSIFRAKHVKSNVKLVIGRIGAQEQHLLLQSIPELIKGVPPTIARLWTQAKIQNSASAVGKNSTSTHMVHGSVEGATCLPKLKEETPPRHSYSIQVLIFVDYNARLDTGPTKGRLRSIQLIGSGTRGARLTIARPSTQARTQNGV